MKIDFSAPILNLDGHMVDAAGAPVDEAASAMRLSDVAINALLGTLSDASGRAEQLGGIDKVKHATLAQEIHAATGAIEIEAEQVALLKERIGRAYIPIVVLQAWKLLEGKPLEGKPQ